MTAALTPTPKFTPLDSNGNIMPGAKLFTYDAGTTTKKNTWKDSAKSTLNTNPIILDSAGRADVWGDGSYKLVLAPSTYTDPPTSPIWTVDNINIYNSLDWDGLTATIPQLNACDTSVKFTGNANYTVLLTDRGKTIACNNNTANVNVILPDPTVLENGYMIRIKKTSLSVYTVTVDAGVGYTIDGFYRYYDLIGANNCTWLLWDGTRWNIIQEGFRRNYKAITATGAIDVYLNNYILECNIGAANITLTLPAFSAVGFGFSITIKLCSSGGGAVILDPGAGVTIDGNANFTLSTLNETITIWANSATEWFISSSHNPALYTPVGMIGFFGFNDVVNGWVNCDGSAVSRTVVYDTLFAKIGNTWGVGAGATTFNLPDFRDKSPAGTGAIVGAVGSYHGNATMALGVQHLAPHYHKYKLMYDLDTHSNGDTPNIPNPTNDTLTGNGFNAAETVECASTPFDLWHPVAACLFKIKY